MYSISEELVVLELPTSRAMLAIARPSCDRNYAFFLYHFRVITSYLSKVANFK